MGHNDGVILSLCDCVSQHKKRAPKAQKEMTLGEMPPLQERRII